MASVCALVLVAATFNEAQAENTTICRLEVEMVR